MKNLLLPLLGCTAILFSPVTAEPKTHFSSSASEISTSLRRAILAIEKSHGSNYDGEKFIQELNTLSGNDLSGHLALQRKALLSNPSLDFKDVLAIERNFGAGGNAMKVGGNDLGLPEGNYSSLANSKRKAWTTQITRLKNVFSANLSAEKVYSPAHGGLLTDMDLHFEADRLVFAMARPKDFAYRIYEMNLSEAEPKMIDPGANELSVLSNGKKATASSSWNSSYDATKAFDGDNVSRWAMASGARNGWLEVDLGKVEEIGTAVVKELAYQRTASFAIEYKNGEVWKEIVTGNTIGGEKIYTFSPVKAQCFRLNIKQANEGVNIEEFQLYAPGANLRASASTSDGPDVDHFDPCYLPDGGLILASTGTFLGMPCINGGPRMASLYRLEPDRKSLRQLGFDQDTSWYPTLLPDGRVMYSRWDYADMVHSNNRPILTMNPDGSGQKSISFSNSYFPTSFFFARPIPGHSSQIVGIMTGHHGTARAGRMVITDPAISEHEEKGMVQELPGYGLKVKRKVADRMIDGDWPLILHPYPLAQSKTHLGGGEFFLVSMKLSPKSLWGIYLIDIYDNALLLWETEQSGYFEPIPLKKQPAPPIIPSVLKPDSDQATLYIQNIYHGPGLKDVPLGTVKQLRIGSYQFSTHGNGGLLGTIGVDSGWDIKTIIGVTPVNEDGSVTVQIPAKKPLFFQPLDAQGRLVQGMRSWATAQGGERMSCVGCHESASDMPLPRATQASRQKPLPLMPWLGEERPLSFPHEIQPILDSKCVSCHDGDPANGRYTTLRPEYKTCIPDLRATPVVDYSNRISGSADKSYGGKFTESYMVLHRLVRHPGIESPMAVLNATEFGSSVSELTQILKKGHHGIELSPEEWLRMYTWMDYNAPFHGYRRNIANGGAKNTIERTFKRGNEISRRTANQDNFILLNPPPISKIAPLPHPDPKRRDERMSKNQNEFSSQVNKDRKEPLKLQFGNGQSLELVSCPSGSFTMGSNSETLQESPRHTVAIARPFYMASKEITNAQLRAFDPNHDSQFEDRLGYQFGQECIPVNGDELPAVRVSWTTAMAFCEWLSNKTGRKVKLPTEAQWEWAARAGSGTSFWFGNLDADFSKVANLADKKMELFAECTAQGNYSKIGKITNPNRHEMWLPYVKTVDDGQQIQCPPGSFTPNPWGLFDMHGNVAEWTRSEYKAYPFNPLDEKLTIEKVVRGGSYRDRPYRATSSYRLSYGAWQKVHDVGFRIIVEE